MDDESAPTTRVLTRQELLGYALRLLARRDYSRAEMSQRLHGRCESEGDAVWVLEQLDAARFINEQALAERKAELGRNVRLVGKRLVASELERQQLEAHEIREAVKRAYEDTDEVELARRHLETKLSAMLERQQLEDKKQLQRAYGRLRRAGFAHFATVRALRTYSRLAETLDEMAGDDEPG